MPTWTINYGYYEEGQQRREEYEQMMEEYYAEYYYQQTMAELQYEEKIQQQKVEVLLNYW